MNIHEYQGKSILQSFGVAIQRGKVADSPEAAHEAAVALAEETDTGWFVVKAQIHAGGRGKGVVTETGSHGVVLAKGLEEVKDKAAGILGGHLVTAQTSKTGKQVNKVLIAEDVYYPGDNEPEEYYMSVLLDRATGKNIIMYSPEGGMDIEAVAEKTPHLIFKEEVDPAVGLQGFQSRRIAFNLGLSGQGFKQMVKFTQALYAAYLGCDAAMFEINPVLKTSDDKIIAVDSKVSLDGNALYRHPDYAAMRDKTEEDATEVEADEAGLNYVKLDGNVGCMVNGAGLAMATMDI
ncbi:MAG TPA: succinate--CoA ligase subunit beta, partial [Flavobacteriales bacterium]|nr:succinate--CoA ligase subunit beta [Flavobacteriales bacterium]